MGNRDVFWPCRAGPGSELVKKPAESALAYQPHSLPYPYLLTERLKLLRFQSATETDGDSNNHPARQLPMLR